MVKKHLRPHWRGLPTSRSSRRPKQAARQEGLERPAANAGSAAGRLPHGRDLTLCTIFFIAFFDDLGFLSSITAESACKSCIACILCHPAPSAVAPIPSRACRSGRRRPILKRPRLTPPSRGRLRVLCRERRAWARASRRGRGRSPRARRPDPLRKPTRRTAACRQRTR